MTGLVCLLVLGATLAWPRHAWRAPLLRRDGGRTGAPSRTTRARKHWLRHEWRNQQPSDVAVVAEFAELLALCLAAGLGADRAVDLTVGASERADPRRVALAGLLLGDPPHPAGDPPGDPPSEAAVSMPPVRGPSATPSSRGEDPSRLLLVAWWMSRERGSPLTAVVATCARTLRAVEGADRRRRAAEAGPRASMWLLTALPLVGPGVAALAGVDLREAYGTAPAAVACAAGVGLTVAGWWWARRLLAAATRPVRHG